MSDYFSTNWVFDGEYEVEVEVWVKELNKSELEEIVNNSGIWVGEV